MYRYIIISNPASYENFPLCVLIGSSIMIDTVMFGWSNIQYSKPVLNGHSQKDRKFVFKTNYRLVIAPKGSILQYFMTFIKLPFVIKIFVLSIFEWPFYTGFIV